MKLRSMVAIVALLMICSVFSCPQSGALNPPGSGGLGPEAAKPWKYDLRPGDHLVYIETMEREVSGTEVEFRSVTRLHNHVLVLGETHGVLAVGFQRNRENVELQKYRSKGKDRLEQEKVKLAERLRKNSGRFVEANEFDRTGRGLRYRQAIREASSRALFALHEIEVLPDHAVHTGDKWTSGNVFNLDFELSGEEPIDGESCSIARGRDASGTMRLQYSFCPASSLIRRLELDVTYSTFSGRAHEVVKLQLERRDRGQKVADWLAQPDTRLAVLQGMLVSPWLPDASEALKTAQEPDSDTQILALSLAYRMRASLPAELLKSLAGSGNDQVKRLAALLQSDAAADPALRAGGNPTPEPPPGVTFRNVREGKYAGSSYILRIPSNYRSGQKIPVLIYLSGGYGMAMDAANGSDQELANWGYAVIYPNGGGRAWWEPQSAETVIAILDEVLAEYGFDQARVFVSGFSNGGTGSLYIAGKYPERFAAAALLMGAGVCKEELQDLDMRRVAHIQFLLLHGDKDEVIPSACSEDTYKDMIRRKVTAEYHLLKGHGHDVSIGNDDNFTREFLQRVEQKPVSGTSAR